MRMTTARLELLDELLDAVSLGMFETGDMPRSLLEVVNESVWHWRGKSVQPGWVRLTCRC